MPAKTDTPAMKQFRTFKEAHPDCLLLFRMGDFYELFFDDAVRASEAIGLTLTQRSEGVPMAGVPHHQLDTYLSRLVSEGFRVAIADQIEDPKDAKGVVARAVTQVVTPGTLTSESLLDDAASNRVAAVIVENDRAWLAVAELSTGEFELADAPAYEARDLVHSRDVRELLHPETMTGEPLPWAADLLATELFAGTSRPAWHFRPDESFETLRAQFGVSSFEGFGLQPDDPALRCAGALVRYLRETQALGDGPGLAHLRPPTRRAAEDVCRLDAVSLRALEIERTIRTGSVKGSLVGLFLGPPSAGGCRTPMGKRLVRDWLRLPRRDLGEITRRHDRVGALVDGESTRGALASALDGVGDLPRVAARTALGRASPRDVAAVGASLARLGGVRGAVGDSPAFSGDARRAHELEQTLAPLAERIARELRPDPPARLSDGGVFADGLDERLDRARSMRADSAAWLAQYQARITSELALPDAKAKIKVGYNKVFGYYIELTAVQARESVDRLAACEMTRKQTLKNAERYITPELKRFEDEAARAEEVAGERERVLFERLTVAVREKLGEIDAASGLLAGLDVLLSFASRALRRGWSRPEMTGGRDLRIEQGRHPVLEELLEDSFTPNDVDLAADGGDGTLALITGPNMAGKSTYIRQAALIALLAHAGSYVPAGAARIGLCDRIFTRVGADDALHEGRSTFMVEMTETANILNNASDRSLVILDEIGRGTSTLDGLSLAWAIAEHLSGSEEAPGPRTLFATHYHELTVLGDERPGRVVNRHVAVREHEGQIVFLHQIREGRAEASYGVQVARLAGLPAPVVERAGAILETLRVHQQTMEDTGEVIRANAEAMGLAATNQAQLGLFTEFLPHPAIEELKSIDLDRISPMQAFDALRSLRERVQGEAVDP